jgi:3-oxoacyl-[acyl-carrier-protein] synthase II
MDIVSTHATGTSSGDRQECAALRTVFGECTSTHINNTKSYIGHAMGAAGALELAGNLGSFDDGIIHPTINCDEIDPACAVRNLVANVPKQVDRVELILNNSFGMLGINSAVLVKKYTG